MGAHHSKTIPGRNPQFFLFSGARHLPKRPGGQTMAGQTPVPAL